MKYKIIKTKKEFHLVMERFEQIFNAKKGTKESEEAQLLSLLINNYEKRNYVMDVPTPLEAIQFRMEQAGMTNTDLSKVLGDKSRVSNILNKTRKLNLNMIRNLYEHWHIPLETLIQRY